MRAFEQANSSELLEQLMDQYGSSLLRMAVLYLKDKDLAEDAVQETFIKAYRHFGNYRGDCSEKTWLTGICMNVCRDMLRTAWFRHTSVKDPENLHEETTDFVLPDNTVLNEVMRLPERYRAVILLRYYQEMKLREIAEILKISDGKVQSRLRKANGILRDRLKEWYYAE